MSAVAEQVLDEELIVQQLDTTPLFARIAAGTLTRHTWTDRDAQGRETACLLAALAPEVGAERTAAACPVSVMRPWLAHLTVWIDDAGSGDAWPVHVRRYAAVIGHVARLHDGADRKLEYTIRALCVREAARHATSETVSTVCDRVATLCEREAAGDETTAKEWQAAHAAADAAYAAAASAAAAYASASAAYASAAAAASTYSAALYATYDAGAAATAATDRLCDAVLTAMEVANLIDR